VKKLDEVATVVDHNVRMAGKRHRQMLGIGLFVCTMNGKNVYAVITECRRNVILG
jgi:hypothetical protein